MPVFLNSITPLRVELQTGNPKLKFCNGRTVQQREKRSDWLAFASKTSSSAALAVQSGTLYQSLCVFPEK